MTVRTPAAIIASLALAMLLVASSAERAEARRGWGWIGGGIAAAVILGGIHHHRYHRRYYRYPAYAYGGGYYDDYYYAPRYYYPRRHIRFYGYRPVRLHHRHWRRW